MADGVVLTVCCVRWEKLVCDGWCGLMVVIGSFDRKNNFYISIEYIR